MARVVETEEPTVVREERVVHDDAPRSNTGAVVAVIILVILLILLFVWRPWGSSSPTVNVTPPTQTTSSK